MDNTLETHSDGRGPREPQTGDVELEALRFSAWSDNAPMSVSSAEVRALITRLDVAEKALQIERQKGVDSALRSIEACNPGIDIERVRREHALLLPKRTNDQ